MIEARSSQAAGGIAVSKNAGAKKRVIDEVDAIEASRGERPRVDDLDWRTFDPASLKGGVNAPLAIELVTYRDCLDDLLRHEGQYVVIKGREIVGYFLDRESDVAAAIARYGRGPVLVKKIVEREPVRRIGHAITA
jgi:hypothetical protein